VTGDLLKIVLRSSFAILAVRRESSADRAKSRSGLACCAIPAW
jgi:hypothetical protein